MNGQFFPQDKEEIERYMKELSSIEADRDRRYGLARVFDLETQVLQLRNALELLLISNKYADHARMILAATKPEEQENATKEGI